MNTGPRIKMFMTALILLLYGVFALPAMGQEINLDKMEKYDDLVCYPSLKDPAVWYYLPDQPRLALKNGRPQFSFMKYSRTSKTGKAGTNLAEGGGIVHFLVTYGADKSRVESAERRLQEKHPDARIAGPIVYRKGSFALITSFQQGAETLVKTVAIGKAPLIEGQKAAVSMALTREGAQLLWESFKGDTPDISLVFDMEFAGVREPYEATIEADWSRVSKHQRLQAGFKYSWFGADVDMLFQELRQDGAIKITTKGENASMDKIVESAHAKLLQVMFDPAPVDDLSRAAAEKDSYSNLNQAIKMMKSGGSNKTGSLNLETPGFKEMIVQILNLLVPEAYAADTSQAPALPPLPAEEDTEAIPAEKEQDFRESVDPNDPNRKLTPEQTAELKAILVRAQNFYIAKNYHEALDAFMQFRHRYYEMTGEYNAASVFNVARVQLILKEYEQAAGNFEQAAQLFGHETADGKESLQLAQNARRLAMEKQMGQNVTKKDPSISDSKKQPIPGEDGASDWYNHARSLDEEAKKKGYPKKLTSDAISAYQLYLDLYAPTGSRKNEVEGRIRSLNRRLAMASKPDGSGTGSDVAPDELPVPPPPPSDPPPAGSNDKKEVSTASKSTKKADTTTTAAKKAAVPAAVKPAAKSSASKKQAAAAKKKVTEKKPGFSFVASYRMKNIKRSGRMVYQMNHFRTEMQSFTMTENIGSLYRRYGNDQRIFRAVTIDDPVFKQREILVTLDGQDAATFTKYLNFVIVRLLKRHQSGQVTTDEVAITPELFNQNGNSFSLNYGYKGDTDREKWLDYQYEVVWSFHGFDITQPLTESSSPMLALTPPYRYRNLTIEGEEQALDEALVRHAVVTVNSSINGRPIITQGTIKNQGPAPAMHLDFPDSLNGENATVSITWYLRGGKKVTADACPIEGDIIYWDELP